MRRDLSMRERSCSYMCVFLSFLFVRETRRTGLPYGFAGGLPSRPLARGRRIDSPEKTRRLSRRCRPLSRKRIARVCAASLFPLCIDGENDGTFIGAVNDKSCAFAGNAKKDMPSLQDCISFFCVGPPLFAAPALRQNAAAARFAANHKSMSLCKFSSHLTRTKAIRQDNPPVISHIQRCRRENIFHTKENRHSSLPIRVYCLESYTSYCSRRTNTARRIFL